MITRPAHFEADERAQQAVGRCGPDVDLDAAAGEQLDRIVDPGERLEVERVGTNTATDAQAGVGAARDVEEASAVRGADADVVDSNRLGSPFRKIRGLSPGNSGETRRRSEEKALNELHL